MKIYRILIWSIAFLSCMGTIPAQTGKVSLANSNLFDTTKNQTPPRIKDTLHLKDTLKPRHDPRIATRRSAILPGWGQAYNKEYWKIPIVYGVLAIPAGLYFYNNSWYKKTKFAFEALYKATQLKDSSDLKLIDPRLKNVSENSLITYRNSFRRDRDYSVLWFILAWGLQVADATVFGHLQHFDVSDDLSMDVTPSFNSQTKAPGLSLILNLKAPVRRQPITR